MTPVYQFKPDAFLPASRPWGTIMLREAIIFIGSGLAIYVWLSATCAPNVSAIKTIVRDPVHAPAWRAAGLAFSIGVLWTGIVTGALLLLTTLAPSAARAFVESPVRNAALLAGGAIWIVRSAWIGMPRFSIDTEIASALAVVSLFRDDVETLRSAEALYRERVLDVVDVKGRRTAVRVATV